MFNASKTSCSHKSLCTLDYQVPSCQNRMRSRDANNRHQRTADYFPAYRPFPPALQRLRSLISSTSFQCHRSQIFVQPRFLHKVKRTYSPSSAALNVHLVAFPKSQPTTATALPIHFQPPPPPLSLSVASLLTKPALKIP
jgi:hypothetical protein